MSKTYIGPAQVVEGATLRVLGSNTGEKYCDIRAGVDVPRLRELAAQNLLALFYLHNLYQPEHRPYVMLWLKKENLITEGLLFHSIQRQPDGDVKINFSHRTPNSIASHSAMLSDIILAEVSSHETPGYVIERLTRTPKPGTSASQKTQRDARGKAAKAKAVSADGMIEDEGPDPYLRHPETGEAVLPVGHRAFYDYARGLARLPEPFTIETSAVVVMKGREANAA